ncbi:hypothetical protein BOO86_08285 [Mycobacterium sp. CBMA 234]|uniref:maleylpyruvate isomerase family mycothiol-dependent enzyme n=1 Tax=Mycolicibacterium sp. CBMA 234 TaxID=1918495 RepID=UPI0012DBE648|nr:maleylpyruvate isomerase family mycothiol-dependent enzyme [Mycolicibacterium sp. CBMA 234]MUL64456.1 hypothetical protein [Mycolicibacterium sp. CBMA 234]
MLDTAYRHARRRISDVAVGLSDDQLSTPVPATPDWTVREVLAHLVGGAADVSAGRVEGAGSDQWTQRQVQDRRGRRISELVAEWDQVAPTVEAGLSDRQIAGPNLAADVICHEGDLHEALGLGRVEREHWQPFLDVMMQSACLRFHRSDGLAIHDDQGQQWIYSSSEPRTVLRADGYELLRASYSRRSRNQIAAWDWTPAPAPQLVERFGLFGPRDDDQPVPGA